MKRIVVFLIVTLICGLLFAHKGDCTFGTYDAGSDSHTFYRAYNQGKPTVYFNWTAGTYGSTVYYVKASYTCYGLGKTEGYQLYQSVGYKGTNQGNRYLNSVLNTRALDNIIPYNCLFI